MELFFAGLEQTLDECRQAILGTRELPVHEKLRDDGKTEVVTALDVAVETAIVTTLSRLYKGVPVVAEETHNHPALLNADYCFVVDPIDGTHELVNGGNGYAICVALLKQGRPVLAIVDFPARNERYRAGHGAGATMNGHRLAVAPPRGDGETRILASPRQASSPLFAEVRRRLPGAVFTPQGGLASKLADVSSGRFDAALFLDWPGSRAPVWDFAAAGLVLREAGGEFTSLDGNNLLDPVPALNLGGWLAAAPQTHAAILRCLQSTGR